MFSYLIVVGTVKEQASPLPPLCVMLGGTAVLAPGLLSPPPLRYERPDRTKSHSMASSRLEPRITPSNDQAAARFQ